MPKTTNLDLELATDSSETFYNYRVKQCGQGTGSDKSNMQKIDDWAGTIKPNYNIGSGDLAWNKSYRAGTITPVITLPTPTLTVEEEMRYIFTALTANATFTAPSGYYLGTTDGGFAGLSPGNSQVFSDLTIGSIYEVSFAVLDNTHIGMIMQEWATA